METFALLAEASMTAAGVWLFMASPVLIIEYILIPFFKSKQR